MVRKLKKRAHFCGHVLREGTRRPAPGKLLPIQKWALPATVSQLRGFLGLTNYFSVYVPHYAEIAAPIMAKLRVNREDGRKGSTVRLVWTDEEKEAFRELKAKLRGALQLWQVKLDSPFQMCTDASELAFGAELRQQFGGEWRPVAFYSRKLAGSQLNWSAREK